jgi:prevent-host-death family protein
MKEVALYDAKNQLSALIQEVEETGEEILITRHGKPAVKLTPAVEKADAERRARASARLFALSEEDARDLPEEPAETWEEFKRAAHEEGRALYKDL